MAHAVSTALGLLFGCQAVLATPYTLPTQDPTSSAIFTDDLDEHGHRADFDKRYGHLDDIALAEAILTYSGAIGIDYETRTLYSTDPNVSLVGKTLDEITALAFAIPVNTITDDQRFAVYMAMEALNLDAQYPYGSREHLNRTAEMRDGSGNDNGRKNSENDEKGIAFARYVDTRFCSF